MIQIMIDGPEKVALQALCQKNQVKPRELIEFLINDSFNRTNRAKTKLL